VDQISHLVRSSVVETREVAEEGYEATRQAALAALSTLNREPGDLDGVTAWLTLIDIIPSSPIVSRFVAPHLHRWYILAEYDWYIHVRALTLWKPKWRSMAY